MSARLLILCPGQGGQHAGMFDLARSDARASAFLARCAPAFDAATMFENRVAQPLVVAASLALWEAVRERVAPPALVAGYSIGELAAHSVAGAIDPAGAVALAARRATLMDDAARDHPGQAMAAISALALDRARAAAGKAGFEIAIVTGEDSCIAGGQADRWADLERAVLGAGARVQRLPVAVASHTALMADAVAPFAQLLEATPFQPSRCAVLSGLSGARIAGKAQAIDHLSRQLAQTIQWSACMDAAAEAGITVALELGPGAALSRMMQARHPHIGCRSASEFRSIDGIAGWVERQLG
jgi:[acyl-carrier-protein] S-malonyltransferase